MNTNYPGIAELQLKSIYMTYEDQLKSVKVQTVISWITKDFFQPEFVNESKTK